MLEEYNHYITFRADPLPITKISYRVNNSTKESSMGITRDNQPLNLTAGKLGIPPPPQLTTVGLSALEKKRKRSSKLIKEVFVKEYIVVDGMHRNLVPPPGVVPPEGLVIIDSENANEMYRKMIYVIEARDNLVEARKIVKDNLDNLGQD
ncbi:hypothetical protein Tco_0389908 [Tanacetum coccineum]